MNNKKIIKRLEQLRKTTEKKVIWNRERALKEINNILEQNREDMESIRQAYQTEIDLKELELNQLAAQMQTIQPTDTRELIKISKQMQEVTKEIAQLKKRRKIDNVNGTMVLKAATILNRMYGLDITKVEIKETDETRENVKNNLSIEELKQLAYAKNNTLQSTESD